MVTQNTWRKREGEKVLEEHLETMTRPTHLYMYSFMLDGVIRLFYFLFLENCAEEGLSKIQQY